MSDSAPQSRPWEALPKWPRRLVTVWLVFHLVAIVSAPASVAPASDLARATWSVCSPYLQVLYLNHGYHFFAPDPGESTLLSYTAEKADGTTIHGAIPHPEIWPRLLYHRHFMLTESLGFVASVSESLQPPVESLAIDMMGDELSFDDPNGVEVAFEDSVPVQQPPRPEDRGLLRDWYQSYANCILNKHDAQHVELTRVVHYLPEIEWMQDSIAVGEPLTLGEPASFEEFPIDTFDFSTRSRRDAESAPDQVVPSESHPSAVRADLALTPTGQGDARE